MHLFVLMWKSQGARKPYLKALNVVNCSEIRGTYKMLYQHSFNHNLVSFRRAYQCYCKPCKKGTFLFKKGTFSHHFKSWGGGTCPQCPPPLPKSLILRAAVLFSEILWVWLNMIKFFHYLTKPIITRIIVFSVWNWYCKDCCIVFRDFMTLVK